MKKSIITAIVIVSLLVVGLSVVAGFSFAVGPSQSASRTFVAHLSAASGVNTKATGEATFRLSPDGKSISYKLVVSNINNVFMAHIHLSATGDILVWLYPNPNTVASGGEAACIAVLSGGSASACPGFVAGRFDGVLAQGTLTAADLSGSNTCAGCKGVSFAALISAIEAGETYVNVHTTQNPGGEIQGTILSAPHHPPVRFQSSLVGSYPGVTIDGFKSGGAPWTVASGQARLSSDGMLNVNIDGLLLYGTGTSLDGTTGPVTQVLASVVCETTSGLSITNTSSVALSSMGNAHISQDVPLPSTCFAPQILIRIAATTSGPATNGAWIAATGFESS